MSRQGDLVENKIKELNEQFGGQDDLTPFAVVLDILKGMNQRIQVLEREVGYSDSFVDPNDANTRVTNA